MIVPVLDHFIIETDDDNEVIYLSDVDYYKQQCPLNLFKLH